MSVSQQLRALDLTGSRLNMSVMAAFGETDAVSKLNSLVLNETELDDDNGAAFEQSIHVSRLETTLRR